MPDDRLPLPPCEKFYVVGYDQEDTAYPIIGVQHAAIGGAYPVAPASGTAAPTGSSCNGVSDFPAGYELVSATILAKYQRVEWLYKKVPSSTVTLYTNTERGDPATEATTFVDPASTPPDEGLGITVQRQLISKTQAKETVRTIPLYGWMYSSLIDAETGIIGNVAKTFVAASQDNKAAMYIGPAGFSGNTFGDTGDLVVFEFQESSNINEQIVVVTVFSLSQIIGLSQVTSITGNYPIPQQLVAIVGYADESTTLGEAEGDNFDVQVRMEWDGDIALFFYEPPTKLVGTLTRTYGIGPITPPTATQLSPVSGDAIVVGGSQDIKVDEWSTDSGNGGAYVYTQSVRNKVLRIDKCLCDSSMFPSVIASLPTPVVSGSSAQIAAANASIDLILGSSSPKYIPSTITDYDQRKQRFELYAQDQITWTVPTIAIAVAVMVPSGKRYYIATITILYGGSGYTTGSPTVTIVGGGSDGTAAAVATADLGEVILVNVTNAGSFTSPPAIIIGPP